MPVDGMYLFSFKANEQNVKFLCQLVVVSRLQILNEIWTLHLRLR